MACQHPCLNGQDHEGHRLGLGRLALGAALVLAAGALLCGFGLLDVDLADAALSAVTQLRLR